MLDFNNIKLIRYFEEIYWKEIMLKTCSHCGIVSDTHVCPHKRVKKKYSEANDIRKTSKWHKKSLEIRERDNYLCRVCMLNKYNTVMKYNPNDLSVHHIIPLEVDNTKAFDNNNLITLCRYHHDMAECGDIPTDELLEIVRKDIRVSPPYH